MKLLVLAALASCLALPVAAQPTSTPNPNRTSTLSPNNQHRMEEPRTREAARQDRIQNLRVEERRAGFPSNRRAPVTVTRATSRTTSHTSRTARRHHRQQVCSVRHHHRVCHWQ